MDNRTKKGFRRQTADPVKDKSEITMIYRRLLKRQRIREAELFLIGCNVALRISDLLRLQFSDVREDMRSGHLIGFAEIQEKKTKKFKQVTFNTIAMMSIKRLKQNNPNHEYLFQATGNRVGRLVKPVGADWINRVFKTMSEDLELDFAFTTHSMRKTFGYHAYHGGADINVLQRLFNHSNVRETFLYIGITEERVMDTYMDFMIEVDV